MGASYVRFSAGLALTLITAIAGAHGDVTPQAVDVSTLPPLGQEWLHSNPYSGNKEAIRVGTSAYTQNCARCHGLEAISGGFSPDLRKLDDDCAGLASQEKKAACLSGVNDSYTAVVRHGVSRNGAVYMPPFEGIMSQEAVWAIKSYLETRRESK
jgi:cytochrome c-550 PedF